MSPLLEHAQIDEAVSAFGERAWQAGIVDLCWGVAETPIGELGIAVTRVGLVQVSFAPIQEVLERLAGRLTPRILHSPSRTDMVRRQLDEYFAGRRHRFELELDWRLARGFRAKVLKELVSVPFGTTVSYRDLAVRVGNPRAVRAVGSAMATNPIPIVVPCHRVLRTGGGLGGYGGGLEVKKQLLRLEGVTV